MFISSNRSKYPAELFIFVDKDARKHAVVVVKSTFRVAGDGPCWSDEEQLPIVYADEHYGDPTTTSVRYETDCVPPKPKTELLVVGDAMSPNGSQVTSLEIGVAGPGLVKKARVFGDRIWLDSARGPLISRPEPFATMPVTFDRAFGGSDHEHPDPAYHGTEIRNFVGRGFRLDRETLIGKPLPNIERPGSEMRAWNDKPEPIGFGVVGRGWQSRIPFAGTYDEAWMKEKMPFLPEDFDQRYFQAAPPDQQGLSLAPGERYQCLNMSPTGRFRVDLPPHRIGVGFHFDDRVEHKGTEADTLILEPNVGRIVMVRRATVPLPRKVQKLREVHVGPPVRDAALT